MQPLAMAWGRIRHLRSAWRGETAIVTGSFVLINAIRILSTIVLTRLLAPEVFGVIGILTSIAYAVAMVSDVGFQAFVIRHEQGDDKRFRNVIWTIRLLRSLFLTILLYLLAGPIAGLLAKPELIHAIEAFSLYFLLEGMTSLAIVSAYRNRQLVRLNMIEIAAALTQVAASVLIAIQYPTYWAILIAILISSSVKVAMSYAVFPDSGQAPRFDRAISVELFRFARFITGSSIITLLISQTDKLVLSRLFSLEAFGLYIIATSLAQVPVAFANSYTNQILYPRYSQTWRDTPAALGAVFYSTKRVMHALYMLGVGGMVGAAPVIIEILYDDRYRQAALYLSILGCGSLLTLTNLAAMVALLATGKPQVTFQTNLARIVWLAVFGPMAWLWFGPIGVAIAIATIELPALAFNWWQLHRAKLLSMGREMAFLGIGVAGFGLGRLASWALMPIVHALA